MGPFQPRLPIPTLIPENHDMIVIDLKDCFFTIPLHPDDKEKFAFSVLTLNNHQPLQRHQWKYLPQGMMNSPTICQRLDDLTLRPLRQQYPTANIYHYMDDILIPHSCPKKTNRNPFLSTSLFNYSRINHHSRKISNFPSWKYLGLQLLHTSIKPTQLSFRPPNPLTLHSLQQFLGHLN